MSTVLHADTWATVRFDAALGLLRYERNEVGYAMLEDMERSYAAIAKALVSVPPGTKLLLDMRRAPPRNDDGFEARTTAALDTLLGRFSRHATLVRTAIGKLQTRRIASQVGRQAHVFDDEREALAYLVGR